MIERRRGMGSRRRWKLSADSRVWLPLLAFAVLAQEVWDAERPPFDCPVQMLVHHWSSSQLDAVMVLLSHVGSAWMTVQFGAVVAPWR